MAPEVPGDDPQGQLRDVITPPLFTQESWFDHVEGAVDFQVRFVLFA